MDASEILENFKAEISKSEYENYISLLIFNEKLSKYDSLVFNAPNELIAKFIQSKYALRIAYFYEVKTGNKAKVQIQSLLKNKTKSNKIDIAQIKAQSTILNPSYTFENFVVGDSNKYAYSICKAATEKNKLGKLFNPIFVYGPTGLGKTHLLQAVGNFCLEEGKKVIYTTSENFVKDYFDHLNNKTMEKFKEKYRNCDILLIDDVQFLGEGKKEKIQEEFFFTFNEVKEKNGQIIMTSDNPPNMLKGITERLKSRFANGIISDITPPGLETKVAIIRKKCEFNEIKLDSKIINYIATEMGDNVREIEGIIANLSAISTLTNKEITLDITKDTMKDYIKEKKEHISIDDILNAVCKEFNTKASDIKSNKKTQTIVNTRRVIIFLARELTSMSTPQLAKFFAMKDHTAISHNIKKINLLIEDDDKLKIKIEELRNKILIKKQSLV